METNEAESTVVDSSLEQVIELVDSWMGDNSGYDQFAYPEVEVGLLENDRREGEGLTR